MAKTILITGATAGFGEAMARRFARKGNRLIICGRRSQRLQDLAKSLSDADEVHCMAFDVRERDAVQKAFDALPADYSPIDILINNAGLALGREHLGAGHLDDWDTMIDTNVKGLLYVTRFALPFLRKAAQPHILNIGSIAGTEVYPGGNVYCASKHAVDALSRAMRQEFLPEGIAVSQIRPGLAETEFSLVRFKGDARKAAQVYAGMEALSAEDVADAAEFVLSRPAHVCINDLEITPRAQANAFLIHRDQDDA